MFIQWLVELIVRVIPEMILFIGASFALTKTKVNKKNLVLSSLMLCVILYITRLLPVNYGIPSLVSLISLCFLNVKINKIKTIDAIKASVLIFITMFVSEFISIVFMQVVLKINMNEVFKNPTTRSISGIPSLFIFAIVIFIIYKKIKKINK